MNDNYELLVKRLREWAAIHGRKLTDEATAAWMELFVSTDPEVLSKALLKVSQTAEKMPTPGQLRKVIFEVGEKMGRPRRQEADPACRTCMGTGFFMGIVQEGTPEEHKGAMPCSCRTQDPEEQMQRWKQRRDYATGTDPETGAQVNVLVDAQTGETLYRAQDCPEGRTFLATLHKMASEHSIPKAKTAKQLERERQRQVNRFNFIQQRPQS